MSQDDASETLENNIDAFREVVESAGHSIYWTDTTGKIEYVNPAFEKQTGFSAEEAIGNNANILQSGVHDDQYYQELWEIILSGEVWEGQTVNKRKDGELYVAKQTISPATNNSGEIVRFVCINEDITELKEYQAELEQERERFKTLLNTIPVPLAIANLNGKKALVEQVNEAFEEQFGFLEEELFGSSIDEYITGEMMSDHAQTINERIEQDGGIREEVTRRTASGEERKFLLIATRLTDPNTDNVQALGTYVDITDQKRAEEVLRQKNEHLERFADIISHDLRNPLNVAMGHVELVSEDCDSRHLDPIRSSHLRMQELIENILTLARQGQEIDSLKPVALDKIITECWKTTATADAELETKTSQTILADEKRVKQLFGNLIRNAVEHGGTDVTITVGQLDAGFYFSDTGPGIPEQERNQVFETSYTTSDSGTGFGLSIVKEIAEAHGWTVAVTEGEMSGARFEFSNVEIVD